MEKSQQKPSEISEEMREKAADAEERMKKLGDEEKNNPDLDIFHTIFTNVTDLLDQPEVQQFVGIIESSFGAKVSTTMTALMAAVSSRAAYDAVALYNEKIITGVLENMGNGIESELSSTNIELSAVKDAVSVLRERIESLRSELVAQSIKI